MQLQGFQKKTIPTHESFGSICSAARKKKRISVETAEHETRIRAHYLEAIEADRWHDLPATHCKGFIRRYAAYLGIDMATSEQAIEHFTSQPRTKHLFSPNGLERHSRWFVTPKVIAIAFSVIVLLLFIGYVTYQVKQFAAPPVLQVTKPTAESIVTSEMLMIEGVTEPGALVTIDSLQATVGSDGHFSYPLTLRPGLNQIVVQAENRIKKKTTTTLAILYQAPVATPSPTPILQP